MGRFSEAQLEARDDNVAERAASTLHHIVSFTPLPSVPPFLWRPKNVRLSLSESWNSLEVPKEFGTSFEVSVFLPQTKVRELCSLKVIVNRCD